jgi:hypothetical protein
MNKNLIIAIILVIAAGTGGFFGGMKYQQGKQRSNLRQFAGNRLGARTGENGTGGNNNLVGFRPVSGEIIESDDKSITVKLQDGSSKIVLLAESTQFLKSLSGSKADLKVGDKVMVVGSDNTDGSVTAQNIQINPPARRTPESNGQ